MMRCSWGSGGEDGARPLFTILIPGELGTLGGTANLPDAVDMGRDDERVEALIQAIGFVSEPYLISDWVGDTPKYLKYTWVGIWRGRWCISGALYSRSPDDGYPGVLLQLSAFINRIQVVAGELATVYGEVGPTDNWLGERYQKQMIFHRYLALHTRYRPRG
jgi:hypothetical protein